MEANQQCANQDSEGTSHHSSVLARPKICMCGGGGGGEEGREMVEGQFCRDSYSLFRSN